MEYFISDFHFGHCNTLKFERYCFDNIQQHDDYIINILKKSLTGKDVLYFLGDLGYPTPEIEQELRNLPCKKIMIQGNHDTRTDDYYLKTCGFDEYYKHPIWIHKRIMLSHYPEPVEKGIINIHGHLHGSYLDMKNYVNASIHVANYRLISRKQIDRLMGTLEKPNYRFFYEWWNGHQKLTQEQIDNRNDLLIDTDGIVVAYNHIGIFNHQPIFRGITNQKQLAFRTVLLDGIQYTIVNVSEDGLTLTLVNMQTGEEIVKPLCEIEVLEGYGRLYD